MLNWQLGFAFLYSLVERSLFSMIQVGNMEFLEWSSRQTQCNMENKISIRLNACWAKLKFTPVPLVPLHSNGPCLYYSPVGFGCKDDPVCPFIPPTSVCPTYFRIPVLLSMLHYLAPALFLLWLLGRTVLFPSSHHSSSAKFSFSSLPYTACSTLNESSEFCP